MDEVFVYADEYGDLDFSGNRKSANYFGIGTATYAGPHGDALQQGLSLRCRLGGEGIPLQQGFHAQNDSGRTRHEVFALLREQEVRFDSTFLAKSQTKPHLRNAPKTYMYKLALHLHLKYVIPQIAPSNGVVYVILGSLQTAGKREAVRAAVKDVCDQIDLPLSTVIPCIWDAPSSWGVQAADYGLWAAQRKLERGDSTWLDHYLKEQVESRFTPWGLAR